MFCPQCNSIQLLGSNSDFFAVTGTERQPRLDLAALERRYYELSRRIHPDRFQTAAKPACIASASNTALLNRAYRTLRDPVERGIYWLKLNGQTLSADNKRVPAELAELVFSVQETIAAAKAGSGTASAALRQNQSELQQREASLLAALESNFAAWGDASAVASLTTELKRLLADIAYVRTLMRDVDRALETQV